MARQWQAGGGHNAGSLATGRGQDAVTQGPGAVGVAVGAQRFGPARDRHQQRRLGGLQRQRRGAEPGERPRPDALQIAAHRRQREPHAEDFAFGEPRLQLHRADDFCQFGLERTRPRLQQPRRLHGERGSAGHHAPGAQILNRGTGERQRVHAGMVPEMPVLDGDERVDQAGRHVIGGGAEAPYAAGGREQSHGAAGAVGDFGADIGQARQVGREQAIEGKTNRKHCGHTGKQAWGSAPNPARGRAPGPHNGRGPGASPWWGSRGRSPLAGPGAAPWLSPPISPPGITPEPAP